MQVFIELVIQFRSPAGFLILAANIGKMALVDGKGGCFRGADRPFVRLPEE